MDQPGVVQACARRMETPSRQRKGWISQAWSRRVPEGWKRQAAKAPRPEEGLDQQGVFQTCARRMETPSRQGAKVRGRVGSARRVRGACQKDGRVPEGWKRQAAKAPSQRKGWIDQKGVFEKGVCRKDGNAKTPSRQGQRKGWIDQKGVFQKGVCEKDGNAKPPRRQVRGRVGSIKRACSKGVCQKDGNAKTPKRQAAKPPSRQGQIQEVGH